MEKKIYNSPEMGIFYVNTEVICTSLPDNDVPFLVNDDLPDVLNP